MTRRRPGPPCPRQAEHTVAPDGYVDWHYWAEEMQRTHRPVKCEGCGKWAIWVERQAAATPGA